MVSVAEMWTKSCWKRILTGASSALPMYPAWITSCRVVTSIHWPYLPLGLSTRSQLVSFDVSVCYASSSRLLSSRSFPVKKSSWVLQAASRWQLACLCGAYPQLQLCCRMFSGQLSSNLGRAVNCAVSRDQSLSVPRIEPQNQPAEGLPPCHPLSHREFCHALASSQS